MRRAFLLVLAACGSSPRAPAHGPAPTPPRPDTGPAVVVRPEGPSDAQCTAMVDHALALGIAEDAEPTPPEAQARLRAQLEAEFTPRCRGIAVEQVQCAMAAASLAALEACQRSPSSSTSNSSVAPPGIAPPAPRAP
jgi:hypothetical protein